MVIAGIALMCALQIMVPIYRAQAIIPVSVDATIELPATFGSWVQNILAVAKQILQYTLQQLQHIEDYARDYILKPALRVAMATLVQQLTNQTVGWITGDGGNNVGFAKNLENNAIKEADARAGEFFERLTSINLCSVNLKKFVKINLSAPTYNNLNPQLACTLEGIRGNIDSFYNDFSNGGWATFVEIAANPQNNGFGATLIAQANFEAAVNARTNDAKAKADQGKGFLGVQITKDSDKCEWMPGSPAVNDPGGLGVIPATPPHRYCYKVQVPTTPGNVIADALNKNLNSAGLDFLNTESVNIINNAVSTIMTAVVQRLMKEATHLF